MLVLWVTPLIFVILLDVVSHSGLETSILRSMVTFLSLVVLRTPLISFVLSIPLVLLDRSILLIFWGWRIPPADQI